MGAPTPYLVQASYRIRNDDGNETAATWKAALDEEADVATGTKFRVRVLVQETDGDASVNFEEMFYFRRNSGAWTKLSTFSSYVVGTTSTYYTHGDDTTQQLGSGSFIADNDGMTQNAGAGSGFVPDFAGNDEVEFETCMTLVTNDVNHGDHFEFKVTDSDSDIDEYAIYASIIVEKIAGASRRVFVVS